MKSELSVVYVPLSSLTAFSKNARTHSKQQIRQIAASVKEFGFTNPVLVDQQNTIIAGHGRVEAAKLLGLIEVPTICLERLSPDQIRAYVIADNKLALSAGWDNSILAIELQHLLTIQTDFDVSITGFSVPEIDMVIGQASEADEDDEIEPTDLGPAVCQPGDVWCLGNHRIVCGSSLREESFATLLGERKAHMVFADPPYNVPIDGHASGNGAIKHHDFAMACGEMSETEFTAFLSTSLELLAKYSQNGSLHYLCMDWRHMGELLAAGRRAYHSLLNMGVWVKGAPGMGSFLRSQHELIFVFKNGSAPYRNHVQLGRFGRNRSNVWHYPSANSFSKSGDEGNLLALHPTVKPVALVADAILDCTARGDLILDSFLGSGSTLIAAERVGRVCFGIELDPLYVDVAIRRWQRRTGDQAVNVCTGKLFDEMVVEEVAHG